MKSSTSPYVSLAFCWQSLLCHGSPLRVHNTVVKFCLFTLADWTQSEWFNGYSHSDHCRVDWTIGRQNSSYHACRALPQYTTNTSGILRTLITNWTDTHTGSLTCTCTVHMYTQIRVHGRINVKCASVSSTNHSNSTPIVAFYACVFFYCKIYCAAALRQRSILLFRW